MPTVYNWQIGREMSYPHEERHPQSQFAFVFHHAFLREQLPFLTQLIDKVVDAHGQHHPELRDVRLVFAALRAELEPHMMKEEQILFPAVRTLEQASHQVTFPFGSVQNPIRMMEHEHDNAGQGLRRLRELTGGFAAPDDACNAYPALSCSASKWTTTRSTLFRRRR